MSDNAIKLLNIKWVQLEQYSTDEVLKYLYRGEMLRHIAAKIIGAGC